MKKAFITLLIIGLVGLVGYFIQPVTVRAQADNCAAVNGVGFRDQTCASNGNAECARLASLYNCTKPVTCKDVANLNGQGYPGYQCVVTDLDPGTTSCEIVSASSTGATSGTATGRITGDATNLDRIEWTVNGQKFWSTINKGTFTGLAPNTTYTVSAIYYSEAGKRANVQCSNTKTFKTEVGTGGDFSCKLELDTANSNNLYGGKFLGKVAITGTKPADAQLYCLIDGKQAAGNPRSSDYCDILGVSAGSHTMKAYYYTNGGNTLLASCGQIQATVNTGPGGGTPNPSPPPGGFNTNPCYIQLVKPTIGTPSKSWQDPSMTWVEGSVGYMNNLYIPKFGPLQGPRIAWNYAMAGVRAQGAGGKGTLQDLEWLSQRIFNKSWTQVQNTEQQNNCPLLQINDACNSNAANNPLAQCGSGQTCHILTQVDSLKPPSYTCTAPGRITPTTTRKPTNTKTPTPTPAGKTTHYKMVEANNDTEAAAKLKNAPEVIYDSLNHTDPVKLSYTFEDNNPGFKNLYFQFIDKSVSPVRISDIIHKRIRLLGGKPELTSIKCEYDSASDVGTIITIKGRNFGNQNRDGIKVASQSASVLSWTDQVGDDTTPTPTETISPSATASPTASPKTTTTPSATTTVKPSKVITPSRQPVWGILGAKASDSQVKARIDSRPSGNIKVSLTTLDGQTVTGTCRIGVTTLDFTSTLQCRTRDNFNASNVDIKIFEKDGNKKPLVNQKVDFDSDGRPIDFAPVLEAGKKYVMLVKAPQTLAKKVEFTAEDGTVTIPNIYIPVGDIHPLDFADGIINTLDKGELIREWSTSTDTVRAGDFNSDTRVNSIDYSCLLLNFNKSDDKP